MRARRSMGSGWRTALVILVVAGSASQAASTGSGPHRLFEPLDKVQWPRIVRPSLGLPAVVCPGDAIEIIVGTDERPRSKRCRVRLVRCDVTINVPVRDVRKVRQPDRLWTLRASMPSKISHHLLYDLYVDLAGSSLEQPNAVQIVPRFGNEMTCVQITDTEVNDKNPEPAQRLARAIREINVIAPDVVLATGDLTYDGRAKQYDILIDLFRRLEVPVFTQIGNADYHGDESIYFGRLNAYRDYAVDVGGLHLSALDSGTNYKQSKGAYNLVTDNQGTGLSDDQVAWLQDDLSRAPAGSARLAFMHFPAVSQLGNKGSIHFNRERFKQICERGRVALVLGGHTHVDAVFDQREKMYMAGAAPEVRPCYVQTATTSSHTRMPILPWSYRIIRVADGRVTSFTYDTSGKGKPGAMKSVPVGKLDVTFEPANDGTAQRIAATVKNGLNETLDRARLTFRVPAKPTASYRVEGGKLICTVPDGATKRLIVRTHVPAASERTVRVMPK